MKASLFLALGAVLIAGCSTDPPEREDVELEPYLIPCQSWFTTACMVGRKTGGDTGSVSFYQGEIGGFEFAWGYRHHLIVEAYPVRNPPADGSSIRYEAGAASRTVDSVWEFRTYPLDSAVWSVSGDTLRVMDYPRAILIPDTSDLNQLKPHDRSEWLELTVRPGNGESLLGDSVAFIRR